ncbi:MAG: acyl-CoA thioesterase [Bacteroidota bacterium]
MESSPSPERYEIEVRIEPADIDQLGHVNNVVYLRWVHDAAVAHWSAAATPEQQAKIAWVVVRHEIDYKRSALQGDAIVARTWVGKAAPRAYERFTDILRAGDGKLLAHARTLWCPIDMKTGRPIRVGSDVEERFSTGPAEDSPES